MKGGRVFQTMEIKEGGERFTNVTRIITLLKDDFTVAFKNTRIDILCSGDTINPTPRRNSMEQLALVEHKAKSLMDRYVVHHIHRLRDYAWFIFQQ